MKHISCYLHLPLRSKTRLKTRTVVISSQFRHLIWKIMKIFMIASKSLASVAILGFNVHWVIQILVGIGISLVTLSHPNPFLVVQIIWVLWVNFQLWSCVLDQLKNVWYFSNFESPGIKQNILSHLNKFYWFWEIQKSLESL